MEEKNGNSIWVEREIMDMLYIYGDIYQRKGRGLPQMKNLLKC